MAAKAPAVKLSALHIIHRPLITQAEAYSDNVEVR